MKTHIVDAAFLLDKIFIYLSKLFIVYNLAEWYAALMMAHKGGNRLYNVIKLSAAPLHVHYYCLITYVY